ncbi:MAG TPA: hypothetical protein PKM65_15200 [Spirochaetota bacterium]|nr:hypothetical protein [Spirochaetota bacterium]HNT10419.1 hypothetical protein [Spirochaetota bacterium]
MAEPLSPNAIIVIKARFGAPERSASGIAILYISPPQRRLLKSFAVVASGDELAKTNVTMPCAELMDVLGLAHTSSDVFTETTAHLVDGFPHDFTDSAIGSVIEGALTGNNLFVDELLKRSVKAVLAVDKVEVLSANETISTGRFEEIKVEDELDRMTFADQVNHASRYLGNKRDLAEQVTREKTRDLVVVQFAFNSEAARGGGMLFYNTLIRSLSALFVWATREKIKGSIDVKEAPVDFHRRFGSLMGSVTPDGKIGDEFIARIRKIHAGSLHDILSGADTERVREMMATVLGDVLKGKVQVAVRAETMRSLVAGYLFDLNQAGGVDGKDPDRMPEATIIPVLPVLSPARGRPLTSLVPGDQVQVRVDKSNTVSMRLARSLNLIEGDTIKPMSAHVHSIKKTKDGYNLYVNIAKGLIGKCEVEADIRIKAGDPFVEQEIKKSRMSLIIGIVAGIVVIVIGVIVILALT